MAQWSVCDVPLPPIEQNTQCHLENQIQSPVRTSPRRRNHLGVSASHPHSPSRLSPRVQRAIRDARHRQTASPRESPHRHHQHRGLSVQAVEQARQNAAKRSIAIDRYVDEASPTVSKHREQRRRKAKHKKRQPPAADKQRRPARQPVSTQGLVGVTKKDYWKVWNGFLQDTSDPRIMLPAGVKRKDIERAFSNMLSASSSKCIEREQLRKLLEGIGVSRLPPNQEQQLFALTRGIDPNARTQVPTSGSDESSDDLRGSPMRGRIRARRGRRHTESNNETHDGPSDGYTLPQVLACFVHILQLQHGAPFTIQPLVDAPPRTRANVAEYQGGRSPRGSVPDDRMTSSATRHGILPEIVPHARPRRSSTAPSNMRRSVQRRGVPVVFKANATNRTASYSSFHKFQQMQEADRRAGRVEQSKGRNGGWNVPKGSFVRTGDRYAIFLLDASTMFDTVDTIIKSKWRAVQQWSVSETCGNRNTAV